MSEHYTARAIIERRLGRPFPPTRQMAPDERRAVYLLALHILRALAREAETKGAKT